MALKNALTCERMPPTHVFTTSNDYEHLVQPRSHSSQTLPVLNSCILLSHHHRLSHLLRLVRLPFSLILHLLHRIPLPLSLSINTSCYFNTITRYTLSSRRSLTQLFGWGCARLLAKGFSWCDNNFTTHRLPTISLPAATYFHPVRSSNFKCMDVTPHSMPGRQCLE